MGTLGTVHERFSKFMLVGDQVFAGLSHSHRYIEPFLVFDEAFKVLYLSKQLTQVFLFAVSALDACY